MKLSFGPGTLVTAAFIGPGTVTACTLAGANFGFALLWALAFATLATILLQDMAGRLGVVTRRGLGEAILDAMPSRVARGASAILILTALAMGNAAYEAGNLAGARLGIEAVLGPDAWDGRIYIALLGGIAGGLLWFGRRDVLTHILIGLVFIMAAAFLISAVVVRPNLTTLIAGFVPQIPSDGTLTAIALIGTTIVPYNLFLHAASARDHWSSTDDVAAARAEARLSIGLGGVISMLILITAAAGLFGSGIAVESAADMARSLTPVFGDSARYLVGAGLFAAGLTSAITAPLATAYVVTELWSAPNTDAQNLRFRLIALATLLIGMLLSLLAIQPVTLILIAQAANGLLLPIVAGFLLWVMNDSSQLGEYTNSWRANIAGWTVVLLAVGIGLRGIARAVGVWP